MAAQPPPDVYRSEEDASMPSDSRGRTHNDGDGPRMSFGDAIRLIGRRGKLVRSNLQAVQKAYNQNGIYGLAEYLAKLPETFSGGQVIEFTDVRLESGGNAPVVKASLKEPLPLNGPPFVFDLTAVLPQMVDGLLETELVRNAQGQLVRVATASKATNILLNVTSVSAQPPETPAVVLPGAEATAAPPN